MATYLKTAEEADNARIWLKHTFFQVAVKNSPKDVYSWDYDELDWSDDTVREPFVRMYELITNQTWDMDGKSDAWLNSISGIQYSNKVNGKFNNGKMFKFTAEQIAAILINMCDECNLYWDDRIHTKQEKDFFTTHTIFGKVLADYKCFVSGSGAVTPTNPTTPTTAQKAPKSGQPNSFRSMGPLSDKARDLKGQPHAKINLQETFKIVDPKAGTKKETRAFIRPLNPKGDYNGTNRVWIGDANNYGDCTCLFSNQKDATDFGNKLVTASGYPNGRMTIATQKIDPNGYFLIGTAYGDVYIRADNLNEELKEEIENSDENVTTIKRGTEEFKEAIIQATRAWEEYLG